MVAGAAFVINVIFFILLVIGCRNEFLPKKRYTLLANRSIIDSFMSLLTLVFLLAKHKDCDMELALLCVDETRMVYPVPLYLLQIGLTLNYWMLSVINLMLLVVEGVGRTMIICSIDQSRSLRDEEKNIHGRF